MRASAFAVGLLMAIAVSKFVANAYHEDGIAPSPAMASGSPFASSKSLGFMGISLLFYVFGVLMN